MKARFLLVEFKPRFCSLVLSFSSIFLFGPISQSSSLFSLFNSLFPFCISSAGFRSPLSWDDSQLIVFFFLFLSFSTLISLSLSLSLCIQWLSNISQFYNCFCLPPLSSVVLNSCFCLSPSHSFTAISWPSSFWLVCFKCSHPKF